MRGSIVESLSRWKGEATREEQNIDTPIASARTASIPCSARRRRVGCLHRERPIVVRRKYEDCRSRAPEPPRCSPKMVGTKRLPRRARSLWKLRHNRADYSRRSTTYARYDLSFSLSLSPFLSFSRARTSLSLTVRIKRNVTQISAPLLRPVYATHDLDGR